jgi:hypothetical protein
VERHVVHAQLYTYNDTYAPDMAQRFGPFADVAQPLIERAEPPPHRRATIPAQQLCHPQSARGWWESRLIYHRIENPRTKGVIARVRRRIAKAAWAAGLVPLTPLLRPGTLGSSFHCGGSLPMRESPIKGECDTAGTAQGSEAHAYRRCVDLPDHPGADDHLFGNGERASHRLGRVI